ncbi:MAG TPA: M28 family peptidase, partial [Fimbriimonadaceae bacterium]|nr:M28 family peptidase [Fimbriimonadaceae bacterium]
MGQGQDRAHAERSHRGVGAQRKEIRYNLAALGIALSLCACAPAQQSAAPGKFSLARQAKFDQDNAWQHLLKQVSFGPRTPGSEGHIKCRDWIAEQMKKSCENVRLQEFSHKWSETGKDVKMWNIIGEQNWKDAKTRMLLIAHWDTRPYASEESDPTKAKQPIVGANDGASGVAVLLELMRVLKERKPELGIMYLMTDGEDLGPTLDEMFLGAKFFAKNLPKPKPDYGILIDMVGDKD